VGFEIFGDGRNEGEGRVIQGYPEVKELGELA